MKKHKNLFKTNLFNKHSIFIFTIILIFFLSGCQQNQTQVSPTQNFPSSTVQPPSQQIQNVVMVRNSTLGDILVNTKGITLYLFKSDISGKSTCYGDCIVAWPPLLIPANTIPNGNEVPAILGVTKRTDGTYQVTAKNMPLYYFVKDSVPGDVKGQGINGFGALWYVLSPSGKSITSPVTSTGGGSNNSTTLSSKCTQDSDCMTNACCHPTGCTIQTDRVCNLLCTNTCVGPLDCGKGSCGCENGKCVVVLTTNTGDQQIP